MYLEIVTPEAVLFSSEVDSVLVPGVHGEFQMLNNHAPIVSVLKKGEIKIYTHNQENIVLNNSLTTSNNDDKTLVLTINSGFLELNNNKTIILVD